MPLDIRYGVTDRLQAFVNMPVGWANTEISTLGQEEFLNTGGLGDLNAGVTYQLHKSCGTSCDPDVLVTFGFTAPTGNGNFYAAIFETPELTLGQGLWAAYWNVLFVHNYDPIIIFYGFGTRHPFAREFDGVNTAPGGQYEYRAGVGFAVNEHVTLSTMLYGAYISEPYLNGVRLQATSWSPFTCVRGDDGKVPPNLRAVCGNRPDARCRQHAIRRDMDLLRPQHKAGLQCDQS